MSLQRKSRRKFGRVVAISGVDCSGKSTQIAALIEAVRKRGERPYFIWFRVGHTPVINLVKDVLLGKVRTPLTAQRARVMSSSWKRSLWLHIAFADVALLTAVHIRMLPLLGYNVVCDRYIEDSEHDLIVNFGEYAAQFPAWKFVKAIAAKPDVHILLDLPFEEARRRSIETNEPDADPDEKRLRRAALYEKMKNQSDYAILDAKKSSDEISSAVFTLVFGKAT
jgi:thymidylate kinase